MISRTVQEVEYNGHSYGRIVCLLSVITLTLQQLLNTVTTAISPAGTETGTPGTKVRDCPLSALRPSSDKNPGRHQCPQWTENDPRYPRSSCGDDNQRSGGDHAGHREQVGARGFDDQDLI